MNRAVWCRFRSSVSRSEWRKLPICTYGSTTSSTKHNRNVPKMLAWPPRTRYTTMKANQYYTIVVDVSGMRQHKLPCAKYAPSSGE